MFLDIGNIDVSSLPKNYILNNVKKRENFKVIRSELNVSRCTIKHAVENSSAHSRRFEPPRVSDNVK